MPQEGLQKQSGIVLQQNLPVDLRHEQLSRADRNAIESKHQRMRVVLADGTICILMTKPAGTPWTAWGTVDAHWEEIPPDESEATPPTGTGDPGGEPGGANAFYNLPWATAIALADDAALPPGDVVRITERPVPQNASINAGVYAGDLVVILTSPSAVELTARRTRLNPFSGEAESETVLYDLRQDRILRVYDQRGNDIAGESALQGFAFFHDTVRDNFAGGGATVLGGDAYAEPVTFEFQRNRLVGAQCEVQLPAIATAPVVCNSNLIEGELGYLGDDLPAGYVRRVVNTHIEPQGGLYLDNGSRRDAGGYAFDLRVEACRIGSQVNFSDSDLTDEKLWMLMGDDGELALFNETITPTASTVVRTYFLTEEGLDLHGLDVAGMNWVGTFVLRQDEDGKSGYMRVWKVIGLPGQRPIRFRNEMNAACDVHFLNFDNGEIDSGETVRLLTINGATNILHDGLLESVLIRANTTYTGGVVLEYECHSTAPVAGQVEVGDGESPPEPVSTIIYTGDTVTVTHGTDPDSGAPTVEVHIEPGGPEGPQGPEGKGYFATATSAAVTPALPASAGTEARSFVVPLAFRELVAFQPGLRLRAVNQANPAHYTEGRIASWTKATGVLALTADYGIGGVAATDWYLGLAGDPATYPLGTVIYSTGKVTLDLTTGGEFDIDLSTSALGGGPTVQLDYTGLPAFRTVEMSFKQPAVAPFKVLSLTAGKFRASYGAQGVPPLTAAASAEDNMTGYFFRSNAGKMSVVFAPNQQTI